MSFNCILQNVKMTFFYQYHELKYYFCSSKVTNIVHARIYQSRFIQNVKMTFLTSIINLDIILVVAK